LPIRTSRCERRCIPRPFEDHAAHLAEVVLLGNIAIRTNQELHWDGDNLRFTNSDEANQLINPPYRDGWSL
jgi:hypothetical protein